MKNTNLSLHFWASALTLFFTSCSTELDEIPTESELSANTTSNLSAEDFLDYGLHWFDANNNSHKGYNEKDGVPIEVSTSLYNPTKPTMIYFHGWSVGTSVLNYKRNTFEFIDGDNNIDINTVKVWKDKGWNVGVFYWNQFADELEVKDAEAKIWSENGPKGMRYRLSDGTTSTDQSPSLSVSELAFNQITDVMEGNTSNNVRLVGHSLGNQLAVSVAKLMSDAIVEGDLDSKLVPDRIELLDPFWSQDGKSYLGDSNNDGQNDWTGERVRWDIETLKNRHNTAVTWYKSSLILNTGIGDGNNDLKERVAFQSVRLWYLSGVDIVGKHNYVKMNYFWSMSFDAPTEVTLNFWRRRRATGNVAASASAPIKRIRQLMDSGYLWDQVEGRFTPTPDDDQFELKKW